MMSIPCPHFGHVVDHLQLLVFFDDILRQVLGEGEDGCVVLGRKAFLEAKPDGFGADFLELLACTFLGWCGGWKWQPSLVGLLARRAVDACLGTEVPELREQTLVADGFHIHRLAGIGHIPAVFGAGF